MKIGRNDPCPCGSGKKYKHCCYDKDLKERQVAAAQAHEAAERAAHEDDGDDSKHASHHATRDDHISAKRNVNPARAPESKQRVQRGAQRGG